MVLYAAFAISVPRLARVAAREKEVVAASWINCASLMCIPQLQLFAAQWPINCPGFLGLKIVLSGADTGWGRSRRCVRPISRVNDGSGSRQAPAARDNVPSKTRKLVEG